MIYQADFLAFSTNQSTQIYDSFAQFVTDTKTLEIEGQTYEVDKCIQRCNEGVATTEVSGVTSSTVTMSGGPGSKEGHSGKTKKVVISRGVCVI